MICSLPLEKSIMSDAKHILREMVASGKTREALKSLLEWTPEHETGLREEVILLLAQYERWEKDGRMENAGQEEQNIRISRINASLVQLIEKLPDRLLPQKSKNQGPWRRLWKLLGAVAILGILFLIIANLSGFLPWFSVKEKEEWEETPSSLEFMTTDSLPDFPCLAQDLNDLTGVRILRLEEGARDQQLIGPNDGKESPVCLIFTEDRQAVGAILFSFFSREEIFKIAKAIDRNCTAIREMQVIGRSGEHRTLQNWDTIRFGMGGKSYLLRLGYDGSSINAGEFRMVL